MCVYLLLLFRQTWLLDPDGRKMREREKVLVCNSARLAIRLAPRSRSGFPLDLITCRYIPGDDIESWRRFSRLRESSTTKEGPTRWCGQRNVNFLLEPAKLTSLLDSSISRKRNLIFYFLGGKNKNKLTFLRHVEFSQKYFFSEKNNEFDIF